LFVAQLHRKLTRSEEDMEDLLTSNVFGIWLYLPIEVTEIGLLRFLRTSQRLDGATFAGPDKLNSVDMKFWHWVEEGDAKGAEPDVIIELTSSDLRKWLVMVEAKYLSPKSSFPDKNDPRPNDQLAREMHNLRRMARKRAVEEYALIYVTADIAIPRADIEEAIDELDSKTGHGASNRFYWTTWRRLPGILNETIGMCQGTPKALLTDLQTVILRMNLSFFSGMDVQGWTLGSPSWSFMRPERPTFFMWMPISMGHYTFRKSRLSFLWIPNDGWKQITWRWKS